MFILRHFSHHIYDETLRTEVHVLSFLAHLSFAPRFISVILSPHRIRKIAHWGLFLFIFSASQLRTEVHIWKFCHHLEFEALRTEVNFCSFIAHFSFAPRFIFVMFGHVITISRSKHCAPRFILFICSKHISFAPRFIFRRLKVDTLCIEVLF